VLAGDAETFAQLRHGEPVGVQSKKIASGFVCIFEGAPMEPFALTLEDQTDLRKSS
jgi:hypothetical protein